MTEDSRKQLRHQTLEALVEAALAMDHEGDERWEIVTEIHSRGTRDTLEILLKLASRPDGDAKLLACDSLSQLGYPQRDEDGHFPFSKETVPVFLSLLKSSDDRLVSGATTALGHEGLDGLVHEVQPLVDHPSSRVRFSLAFTLGGRYDNASVDMLVVLSSDRDNDVRNWATFGLGTQSHRADEVVLEALRQRMYDPHEETRGEALAGLAAKGDPMGKQAVLHELESRVLATLVIQAAESYADPMFLPALTRWRSKIDEGDRKDKWFIAPLDDAINTCTRGKR